MNKFPFFQHYVIKIIFTEYTEIKESLIDQVANLIINHFNLSVVSQGKHEFTNHGLTKFWVLSQSHLVIHSWPENYALHLDLMTCNNSIQSSVEIENTLNLLPIKQLKVTQLKY